MEAHVRPVGRSPDRTDRSPPVGQAERRAVLLEERPYLVGPPRVVSEFDGDAHVTRKRLERPAQPVDVQAQLRRKLQQGRPQLVAKSTAALDEPPDRFL